MPRGISSSVQLSRARRNQRHAVGLHANQDLLEATQFVHHQAGRGQRAVFVQVQKDLGVALNPRHRVDGDALSHASSSISAIHFRIRNVGFPERSWCR
jgi:hypothetical protein